MSGRKLELLSKLIMEFGLFRGMAIAIKLIQLKKSTKGGQTKIYLPAFKRNVYLRKGSTDWLVFIELFVDKVYDIPLNNPEFILDLGANSGFTTVFYKCKYPNAKIISVEPEDGNFAQLKMNIEGLNDIIPVQAAISTKRGEMSLVDEGYGDWGYRLSSVSKSEKLVKVVPTIPIDALLNEYAFSRIDLLKMDIEGEEANILQLSNNGFLQKVDSMIIELHPMVENSTSSFVNAMEQLKPYSIKGIGENLIVRFKNPSKVTK